MVARRLRRKDMKKDEFVETIFDFGQWLEDNWPKVLRWAGVVVLIVVLGLCWHWYSGYSEEKAVDTLAQGMTRYKQAEMGGFTSNAALDDALALFEEANGFSKRSAAGKSALFYQGATLYRLGRFEEAIPVLQRVNGYDDPPTLQGLSGALLADVYAGAGQTDKAISQLEEMAAEEEAAYPADQALLQLARIHRESGNLEESNNVLRRIAEEFPQSAGAMEANSLLNNPG
jgi:tetratricopeptide (TPR) repeat protein